MATSTGDRALPGGDLRALVLGFEIASTILMNLEGPEHRIMAIDAAGRALVEHEMVGRTYSEVFGEFEGQEIYHLLDEAFTSGERSSVDETRVLMDPDDPASELFMGWTLTPWRHDNGSVGGVMVETRIITETVKRRKAIEQEAAAARDVVLTLQRSLLPAGLPVLPQLRVAAEYRVAADELQAGGDWYDAVVLQNGAVALIVGDVVGHGAEAAAAMARLSPVLHELLETGSNLTDAVDRLDAFAAKRATTRAATVCVVRIDPHVGTLQCVRRGHPAPMIVGRDGNARVVDGPAGGPLGVASGASTLITDRLESDEVVLLYSDGLVERPGETAETGIERLRGVLSTAMTARGQTVPTAPADRLCLLAVERLTRSGALDDVTTVGVHRLPGSTPELRFSQPAVHEKLAFGRRRLEDWLGSLDIAANELQMLALAFYEAAANVVEHAYHDRPTGSLHADAHLRPDGRVAITVSDDGQWLEQPDGSTGGGRGLSIMRAATDTLDIGRGAKGTTVEMTRHVTHAVTPGPTPTASEIETDHLAITESTADDSRLIIAGSIDVTTVAKLGHHIAGRSNGGTRPLLLDLSDVTFLSSAGVQLLHQLTSAGIGIAAEPGSIADEVLRLASLQQLAAG